MDYKIKELAELSGVSARTLRYYDQIGLLKPERQEDNGYRLYGEAQVDRLQQILFYRQLGMPLEEIRRFDPIGIIFTGGPNSVYLPDSPKPDPGVFSLGVPILGICYGCQLMAHTLGGLVTEAQEDSAREYGKTETFYDDHLPRVRMAGLDPDKMYKVTELNRIDNVPLKYEGMSFSGKFLMENGLEIPLKHIVDYHKQDDWSSRVLYLSAQ
mgnify:CR=1 FL=1